jgi:PAS domain S-box-containing protein
MLRRGGNVRPVKDRLNIRPKARKARAAPASIADFLEQIERCSRDLEEARRQQAATANVLKVISRSAFNLRTVLQTLVESAARLCDADNATITREKNGEFYRAEAYGFSQEFIDYIQNIPIKAERGSASGRSLLEGRVVHIPDVKADPEYTWVEAQKLGGYRTVLAVPMLREGVPIGVLTLSRLEVRPFTEKQIELLTTFSDQAAIAIENARLLKELREQSQEVATLNQQLERRVADQVGEIKRAEGAIRAREERWHRLFETSSAGMALIDLTSRYISTNSAFQNMLGYTDEEFKALTAIDITHPDEKARLEAVVAEFASGARQEYHIDKRYMKKDGTPLWVNVTTTYVPATDVTSPMLLGVYINIDDRKRAEQALRASEERWRTVFETSSVGIATSDENLRISAANSAFQRIVGYTEDELREMKWLDLTHEDDRSLTQELVGSLLNGQLQAYNIEKRYRRKDGETIWVNVYNTLVPATATTPAFFPAVVVDITDRIRAERALQQSQAELARVTRVTTMGELATSIAHEINQPLTAIVGRGNACRRWLEVQNLTRAKESLDRVIADADRACEVIKRVRSLTSKAPFERIELNINVVVKEVLAITRGELEARQVSSHLQLNDDIPLVTGDKVQLQQVVLNLVMNAIDAMTAVTGRRVLAIRSKRGEDGGALVTVQDCGHGIDPTNAERIFHPFFTTKPGGIGMGLSISTSIVETHGGRLWATPVRPSGTAFHFSLPGASGPWQP